LAQAKEKIEIQEINPAGFGELLAQQGGFAGLARPP